MRCSMTGIPINDPSEGIYDDGEWISWNWINQQVYEQDLRREYPAADPDVAEVFENLVELAAQYYGLTGRYLQIWGELGELYAEIKFGIKRHRVHAPGSDGRLGNDFVEVKTISPEKSKDVVLVKRTGHFSKLLVVKIDADFRFEGRMIERRMLGKGKGEAKVPWNRMAPESSGGAEA